MLSGVYRGVLVALDPAPTGRILVRIPAVFGMQEVWAFAGSISVIPENPGGWVMFEGGDQAYPVWLGFYSTSAGGGGAVGGSGGNARQVYSTGSHVTCGEAKFTDYVYLCTSSLTVTMPTAAANTNRYTIKRTGLGTVTVVPSSGQTIDGVASFLLAARYQSIDLISDGANWQVI